MARIKMKTARLALVAGFAALMAAAGSASARDTKMAYAQTLGDATAPIGWLQFCSDAANRRDCEGPQLRAQAADLDERRWAQLLSVNDRVNREVEPVTDIDHWGVPELWSYPTDGRGDCEDYVLEKRRRLIALGWPRQALLVTVVRDHKGDGHAVLTVRTDRGDFILDNQEARVMLWADTGYRFVKRQAEHHPGRWVSLGNVDTAIITAQNRR
ncbi:MAG: transglutaminase-like cysteine peptidase [Beijerinckiaceae bacterium]